MLELTEGSGIAASERSPGRLWAHNDSGEPLLVALNTRGEVAGRVRVAGAHVEDWEAVAAGSCAAGSCLHVADIGDNDAERRDIKICRFVEPTGLSDTIDRIEVLRATYPEIF